jgi:hypothetical protein
MPPETPEETPHPVRVTFAATKATYLVKAVIASIDLELDFYNETECGFTVDMCLYSNVGYMSWHMPSLLAIISKDGMKHYRITRPKHSPYRYRTRILRFCASSMQLGILVTTVSKMQFSRDTPRWREECSKLFGVIGKILSL